MVAKLNSDAFDRSSLTFDVSAAPVCCVGGPLSGAGRTGAGSTGLNILDTQNDTH